MFIRESRNMCNNCSRAEWPYKEVRHRLTIDNDIIFNGDLIVPPQTVKKDIIKSIHDDIHCGIVATQRRLKFETWRLGYSRDVEYIFKKCPKSIGIKT